MADWKPFLKVAEDNGTYIVLFVNGEEFGGRIREIYDEVLHLVVPYQKTSVNQSGERTILVNMLEIDVVTFEGKYP